MSAQKFFLVGLPGSGKTTLGKKLAVSKKLTFIDLDKEIERSTGKLIPEIFSNDGEDVFRKIESDCLKRIIQKEENFILATGGGTPCFFDNMQLMNEAGHTIYINTPIPEIKKRLKEDDSRPLMKIMSIEQMYEGRKSWYEQASTTIAEENQLDRLD